MHGAAILDFEDVVDEVLMTFLVGNPASGGVPVETSNWEIRNSNLPVQLEHTMCVGVTSLPTTHPGSCRDHCTAL